MLDITNVQFMGHCSDVAAEWSKYHALVLPSRSEGLPLALVEAMICGRPAITTRVGGAEEIVKDGLNGFLAPSASVQSFDETLERAWSKRGQWREIGLRASADALAFLPPDPGQLLARRLANIAQAVAGSNE
jgi:glycosyltransferase involved in cell wall biosynthesis